MTDKYLVDSSIWIEFARGKNNFQEILTSLVDEDKIVMLDLIVAEVLRGAFNSKEYNKLLHLFLNFPIISSDWLDVAELAFLVARKGFNPPLADIYIANSVIENSLTLITKDRHFTSISSVKKFKYKLL